MLYELSPKSKESFDISFVTLDSKVEKEISDKENVIDRQTHTHIQGLFNFIMILYIFQNGELVFIKQVAKNALFLTFTTENKMKVIFFIHFRILENLPVIYR